MTDVWDQTPWHCGSNDGCEVGGHLGTYWITDDPEEPYTYDEFTDGDHEGVDVRRKARKALVLLQKEVAHAP